MENIKHLANIEKDKQRQQQSASSNGLCRWCDGLFASATIKSVCPTCYKLLIGANLADNEIFGG